jgi:hypothetical protein
MTGMPQLIASAAENEGHTTGDRRVARVESQAGHIRSRLDERGMERFAPFALALSTRRCSARSGSAGRARDP